MKHKEKECTWAPGMQDTDITYAGDHTWAAIQRAQGQQEHSRPRRHWARAAIGLAVLGLAFWWLN